MKFCPFLINFNFHASPRVNKISPPINDFPSSPIKTFPHEYNSPTFSPINKNYYIYIYILLKNDSTMCSVVRPSCVFPFVSSVMQVHFLLGVLLSSPPQVVFAMFL